MGKTDGLKKLGTTWPNVYKYPAANYTVGQLKDREQRLKKDHNTVKSILSKSGFGWDPEIKMATAIDEKWKELSVTQQKWRNRPFPYTMTICMTFMMVCF